MTRQSQTCLAVLIALILVTIVSSSASGQALRFVKITDQDTAIRGTGGAPALHSGLVAFYGFHAQTLETGVFMTAAAGNGGYIVIAKVGDPVPNRPGRSFGSFGNPSTYAGTVAFAGGWGSNPNGIYLGSGGDLEVAVDQALQRFPFLGPEGVTHQIDAFYEQPFFTPLPGSVPFTLADRDEAAPGGGTFATFSLGLRQPSLGGGYASFAALVNHPGGIDGGLYLSEVATDTLQLVANWNNEMPGRGLSFERFYESDTDGRQVVFTGTHGLIDFGGHTGVYVAPLGSDGQGPLTVVAEKGQLAPDSAVPFHQFGDVAIDDGLVVFVGYLDAPSEPTTGIYGYRDGQLFKIIDDADPLFGEDTLDFAITNRGLDRSQLVFRGRYVDPDGPFGQGYGVYVASIAGGVSLVGPGTLTPGADALFEALGAVPGEQVNFIASRRGIGDGPCPPQLGGLCVDLLQPALAGRVTADPQGVATLAVRVPADAPAGTVVYLQAVVRRGPGGEESTESNTLISVVGR